MMNRREALAYALAAGAGIAAMGRSSRGQAAESSGALIQRAIPSSGEMLPMVGLGSSATFSRAAGSKDVSGLKEVLKTLVDEGARVFDTAPGYGASEEVAGGIAKELGITGKVFWATKTSSRSRIEESFAKLAVPKIDLIQVHNMDDTQAQLAILKDLKKQGRVRYIGCTTTFRPQYAELVDTMRREPLDFIGVDYAVDNREAEETILPLARERRIGVLAYAPFGRTSLFRRVGKNPVPDWAADFDARTWAQFFIKFVISHPAVTAVTPATSSAEHMRDNLGGARGRLPDPDTRKKMAAFIDALPGGR